MREIKDEILITKPHHLLDMIKLYGAGLAKFVPDLEYGHDFYRVGNIILDDPQVIVQFTREGDAVCYPCRFFREGRCTDVVVNNPPEFESKEKWNKEIDLRLCKILGITEGQKMSVLDFAQISIEKLTPKRIGEVWKERPESETLRRIELLRKGLKKYCESV